MPLFVTFIGSVSQFLIGFFTRFMSYKAAISLASFLTWVGILTAFVVSVSVCLSNLYGMLGSVGGSGDMGHKFMMGLGMFIPANAGGVLSCMASVWIGCQVYKIRKVGIQNFSK